MKFALLTFDMQGASIAYKMQQEGHEVIVGQIDNERDTKLPEELKTYEAESPKDKALRLSVYDGVFKRMNAKQLVALLQKERNKSDWFIFTDLNICFKYSEQIGKMGFAGNFPTQADRELEVNRAKANEFVKEYYPGIHVGEYQEFKKVKDGIEYLKQTDEIFVLKSMGDAGDTIVAPDDLEAAREQLIDQLTRQKKEYEQMGFILEEKIEDPVELTQQIVFFNGKPLYTTLDIENKAVGAGNKGLSMGCMQNLVFQTKLDDPINKLSFPKKVFEMAKEHPGMFVWDISLLFDKKGRPNFGEFCSNRVGWDAMPTELAMAGDPNGKKIATPYFEAVKNGDYPLRFMFGSAVRILNMSKNQKVPRNAKISWDEKAAPDIYVYDGKKRGDDWVTAGYDWDQAVITGVGNTPKQAVERCYEYVDMYNLIDKYYRPKSDFLSEDYRTSIINRYNYAKEKGLI